MIAPATARLSPAEVAERLSPGQDVGALMLSLLPWAAGYADPPISRFFVGAIALGASGALYAGGNLEFPGMPLSASVHAEQSAVANAWLNDERELRAIAVTATPCGHCRQFLNELSGASRLAVLVRDTPRTTLGELLPSAFGPADLDVPVGLLDGVVTPLAAKIDAGDVLGRAALGAAEASHAPYSHAYAGVALQTADGTIVTGRYAESAAYNPSLPALQCALVELALRRIDRTTITAAVLVEASAASSQRAAVEALLGSFSHATVRSIIANGA
ncbi:MAG TPA: cytidine deaminase [Candidatus Elarobacter sp.]|nr:cytidine deaminase [Candidatus Elarobacter sp.]